MAFDRGVAERLVLAHTLWPVLTSIPVVGVRTAARLLSEVAHKGLTSQIVSRAYYARKVQQGKRHNHALIALAQQRCDVLFVMLRVGTYYEPKSAPNA